MEKIILTDSDGVLVSWFEGFKHFMAMKGIPVISGVDDHYSVSIRYGITPTESFNLIKEFNESSHIADLDSFADSVTYVKKLANDGFKFIVVTSLSDAPQAKYYRTMNLHKLFGNVFDEIKCLKMGMNKFDELNRWKNSGYFWIEDHTEQAEAGHKAGLKTVLIDHSYNSHYETNLFPTVSVENPWEEIYEMVKKEYRL